MQIPTMLTLLRLCWIFNNLYLKTVPFLLTVGQSIYIIDNISLFTNIEIQFSLENLNIELADGSKIVGKAWSKGMPKSNGQRALI